MAIGVAEKISSAALMSKSEWGSDENMCGKFALLVDDSASLTANMGSFFNLAHRGLGMRSRRYTIHVGVDNVNELNPNASSGTRVGDWVLILSQY